MKNITLAIQALKESVEATESQGNEYGDDLHFNIDDRGFGVCDYDECPIDFRFDPMARRVLEAVGVDPEAEAPDGTRRPVTHHHNQQAKEPIMKNIDKAMKALGERLDQQEPIGRREYAATVLKAVGVDPEMDSEMDGFTDEQLIAIRYFIRMTSDAVVAARLMCSDVKRQVSDEQDELLEKAISLFIQARDTVQDFLESASESMHAQKRMTKESRLARRADILSDITMHHMLRDCAATQDDYEHECHELDRLLEELRECDA